MLGNCISGVKDSNFWAIAGYEYFHLKAKHLYLVIHQDVAHFVHGISALKGTKGTTLTSHEKKRSSFRIQRVQRFFGSPCHSFISSPFFAAMLLVNSGILGPALQNGKLSSPF